MRIKCSNGYKLKSFSSFFCVNSDLEVIYTKMWIRVCELYADKIKNRISSVEMEYLGRTAEYFLMDNRKILKELENQLVYTILHKFNTYRSNFNIHI